MKLRQRLEHSKTLTWIVATLVRLYLGLCQRTTRWDGAGLAELEAALAQGPVLLTMWHSRLIMAVYHWPVADGPLSSLHDESPIGRVTGAFQTQLGLKPIAMSRKTTNLAASRTVLLRVRDGMSIGLTADGPLGPSQEMKDPPLEWARVTGLPIFCYAYATKRNKRLNSWDKMLFPLPFTTGSYMFRRFENDVPRKADAERQEQLRLELQAFLIKTTEEADAMLGLPPGP